MSILHEQPPLCLASSLTMCDVAVLTLTIQYNTREQLSLLSPYRKCVSSLQGLPLPSQVIEMSQELAHNVRELCSDTLFIRASNGMRGSGGGGRAVVMVVSTPKTSGRYQRGKIGRCMRRKVAPSLACQSCLRTWLWKSCSA